MVLSNAERQARHQRRVKERLAQSVTPDDVLRAVRIIYDDEAKHTDMPPFDDWLRSFTGKRKSLWDQWPPDRLDPDSYPADLSPDDLALLLRVAAVVRAVKYPPAPE